MASGFNVSALSTFKDETGSLTAKAILEAQNLSLGISIVPGVKAGTNYKLNKVAEEVYPRALGCSFNASGETTYTQSTVTPCGFQVDKSYCPKDLYSVYVGQLMTEGTTQEDFPESQFIFDLVSKNIQKYNDQKMWVGSTSSGDLCNGWITQLQSDSSRISGTTISAPTASNIDDMVDDMYNALVSNAGELLNSTDLTLVMSPANFALWTKALRDANLYNYGQHNDDFTNGVMIPGTNVLVRGLNGLVGTNYAVLTSAKNLVAVFDGVSDEKGLDVWYSKDNKEIRATSEWTLGVGYFFGDEIVTNF